MEEVLTSIKTRRKMMGYRSDVAYTIRFTSDHDTNNLQSFYTFLAEAKTDPRCAIALSEVEVDEKRQRFTFSDNSVKWYESYPDVMSHAALFELAREWAQQMEEGKLNCTIGAMFLRVGEDTNDIEENVAGDYDHEWINVSRSINTDW
jgi:hypothetical protein